MNRLIVGFQTVASRPTMTHQLMGKLMASEVYHCELIFEGENPSRFSAWQDFGTGFREYDPENIGDASKWIFFDLGTAYYQSALDFANSQKGKAYDLKTAKRTVLGKKNELVSPNSWYCSELTYATLVYANAPLLPYNSSDVLPSIMYDLISPLYPEIQYWV